ncbi:competence protein CoiA family protein [Kitasatospora purpeofusca]|uniref:competence protein CoiA family protein n=1 Tax=Kitasatospora purpeofusca TaxID=67352 RepID=UPI004064B445
MSPQGLRFFAHDPGAPDCEIAREGESEAHHLLKLELLSAARDAGARAELEVRAPDGSWRADVLATAPDDSWRIALEAQLSPITNDEIRARTERMRAQGVAACWFSDRPKPPWLGTVPSVRVGPGDGGSLTVVEGLVRFDRWSWNAVAAPTLADFLRWVFARRVVTHERRARLDYELRELKTVWTAPAYIGAEQAHLEEAERQRVAQEAENAVRRQKWEASQRRLEARRVQVRELNEVSRERQRFQAMKAEDAVRGTAVAAAARQTVLARPQVARAIAHLAQAHGITATVGWGLDDPRWAGGVPLLDGDGTPVAVLNPERSLTRGQAHLLMAGLLLLFDDDFTMKRFRRWAYGSPKRPKDQRMEAVSPDTGTDGRGTDAARRVPPCRTAEAVPEPKPACGCEKPHLFTRIDGYEQPAEPSTSFTPTSALFQAHCRLCGGTYERPWRRITAR